MEKSLLKKRRLMGRGKTVDHWENVKREIAIMKKLQHPNIVHLYEVIDDEEDDKLYLVLEYVEGGTVMPSVALKGASQPLPEAVSRKYFRALLFGIEYCKLCVAVCCFEVK
jgi:serine/threonine protein kinase